MFREQSVLIRRLHIYWRLEAANIILVPSLALVLLVNFGGRPSWVSALTVPTAMVPLAIGAGYWRAKLHRLRGKDETLRQLLPVLERVQLPTLALVVAGAALTSAAWLVPGLSDNTGDRVVGTIFVVSGGLEYVNYYHRQLQHFDHTPDWHRLLSGRGFRRSSLAKDLARLRQDLARSA